MKKIIGRVAWSLFQMQARTVNRSSVFVQAGTRRFFYAFLTAFLMLSLAGCKTAEFSSSLTSHPEAYRRVAILPVCFGNASPTGFTPETGELEAVRREAGAELASALTSQLARKGYQVVNPVRVLSSEQDWSGMDLTASWMLRQQFDLERIRAKPGETNELYTCGFVSGLPVMQEKLGLPEADAVILVERWVEHGPAVKPMPRSAENATLALLGVLMVAGGDLPDLGNVLDPEQRNKVLYGSCAPPDISICYSLYLFDPHAPQIIYSAHRPLSPKNPGRAVRALLGPLPKIRE